MERAAKKDDQASTLVDIRSLAVRRGGEPVLKHVDLTLRSGEIYGLIGPNGAGKSTTIAALLGLLPRESGTVSVLAHDPARDSKHIHARCGVLPEDGGFYSWMSAQDYLALYGSLYGRSISPEMLNRRLRDVGLELRTGQTIGTFSKGMRQRLGLARALMPDPELLILDEPTNGLDPGGRREIHDLLLGLRKEGVGILLCTHLLDDVERLCDRVSIVQAGRTIAEGGIDDLVDRSNLSRSFRIRLSCAAPPEAHTPPYLSIGAVAAGWVDIRLDPEVEPSKAWRDLLSIGWPICEIHTTRADLEGVYLTLTKQGAP